MPESLANILHVRLGSGTWSDAGRDAELKRLKETSKESRVKVEEIKSKASAELNALVGEHSSQRAEWRDRCAEYQKRIAGHTEII